MAWAESRSEHFSARHEERESGQAAEVLELLEEARDELSGLIGTPGEEVAVVIHGAAAGLALAQPAFPVAYAVSAPGGRRYLAGWPGAREIHLLSPAVLARRASAVPGSLEMLLLAPVALYVQLLCGMRNPALPPPARPGSLRAAFRNAWLVAGIGQWLSGQTVHARPAIARRLREGGRPAFPPAPSDALLLGGSVLDLVAAGNGREAAVALALEPPAPTPRETVARAFPGRPATEVEGAWRSHLARLAGS